MAGIGDPGSRINDEGLGIWDEGSGIGVHTRSRFRSMPNLCWCHMRVRLRQGADLVEPRRLFGRQAASAAPRMSRSCASLRAPRITVSTPGLCRTQLIATWGIDTLRSRNRVNHVDDPIEAIEIDRARHAELVHPRDGRPRRVAAELAGQQPRLERAPHHQPDLLVQRQRNNLVLDVARHQRVVHLLGDVARRADAIRVASAFITCHAEWLEQPM